MLKVISSELLLRIAQFFGGSSTSGCAFGGIPFILCPNVAVSHGSSARGRRLEGDALAPEQSLAQSLCRLRGDSLADQDQVPLGTLSPGSGPRLAHIGSPCLRDVILRRSEARTLAPSSLRPARRAPFSPPDRLGTYPRRIRCQPALAPAIRGPPVVSAPPPRIHVRGVPSRCGRPSVSREGSTSLP